MDEQLSSGNYKEEILREVCCNGDTQIVRELLEEGVNVNAQNLMNGWTPLHWAVKRGRIVIVRFLLAHGADVNIHTTNSETPLDVCDNPAIRQILLDSGAKHGTIQHAPKSTLPITPNYMKHPSLSGSLEYSGLLKKEFPAGLGSRTLPSQQNRGSKEIVLKVRIANQDDTDFIEVELPCRNLTFSHLLSVCAQELEIEPSKILRVRKLPNTIVRNDRDVSRLQQDQELEFVIETYG